MYSYSKPGFLLDKKFLSQFKNNLQHIQVTNTLNEVRKYITRLFIFFNCLSLGVLTALWYAFKITIKYFGL